MRKLFRFWMTGGVAVVLAALGGRAMALEDKPGISRSSRYSVVETMQRIEASAARHGLSVFARSGGFAQLDGGVTHIIVLESSQGGTPVVMEGPHTAPDLPLCVTIRRGVAGLTEVLISSADWEGLPQQVTRDLESLPEVVDEALT
jgi:uncharacterized protein (DUF302 family)